MCSQPRDAAGKEYAACISLSTSLNSAVATRELDNGARNAGLRKGTILCVFSFIQLAIAKIPECNVSAMVQVLDFIKEKEKSKR